jgi:hypothetical protein
MSNEDKLKILLQEKEEFIRLLDLAAQEFAAKIVVPAPVDFAILESILSAKEGALRMYAHLQEVVARVGEGHSPTLDHAFESVTFFMREYVRLFNENIDK